LLPLSDIYPLFCSNLSKASLVYRNELNRTRGRYPFCAPQWALRSTAASQRSAQTQI